MKTNRKYGRLTDGAITYAPYTLTGEDGRVTISPTAEMYAAAGWMPVVHNAPTPPDGHHVSSSRHVVDGGRIVTEYDYEPDVKTPRLFSKLKIYGVMVRIGAWERVRSWLETQTVNGLNGWLAFSLAQEVSEAHPMFAPMSEAVRELLGLDKEAFDALLDECLLEVA